MPLLVAGLAIPGSLALIWVVAQQVEMSIFVLNIATMLGLALAIDYSLFIVSRFREELRRGRTVGEAVERAIGTAGKAVAFSGIAVGIGLSGLLLFEAPAIRSIGIAGALVVLCSVVYGLTFLPAVLGMLGHRVNALTLSGLRRRFRPVADEPDAVRTSRWERVAHAVMRRPIAVLVPTLVGAAHRRDAVPPPRAGRAGPRDLPARHGEPGRLRRPPGGVRPGRDDPDHHPGRRARRPDRRRDDRGPRRLRRHARDDRRHRSGRGAVLHPRPEDRRAAAARSGRGALRAARRTAARRAGRPAGAIRPRLDRPPRRDQPAVALDARGDVDDPGHPLDATRATASRTQVGGSAATGHDFLVSQGERAPFAVAVTLIASGLILFLLFGSVVIPIKAIIMTLLSISASFGALVWIFQEGHLSGFLDFEPLGYTIAGNPIIMFSVIFGLSMDYEVLLLSRIQEAYRRTGDNTASVAEGLARTAGVITGAALIMVERLRRVRPRRGHHDQEHRRGHGHRGRHGRHDHPRPARARDDAADGRWNWWAPGPLGRLADRLGFSHVEDDDGRPPGASAPPVGEPAGS